MSLPVGHDAWVVGNEPVVAIDWQGASVWARTEQGRPIMSFAQIIEFSTTREADVDALLDQ